MALPKIDSAKSIEFTFEGVIDADFQFPKVDESVESITLHLKNVKSINSMGLRNWILWRKALGREVRFFFEWVPVMLVNQMNILDGFLPLHSEVVSFEVPMACSDCNHSETYLMKLEEDYEPEARSRPLRIDLPSLDCPNCKTELELDSHSDKYFRFLRRKF